METIHVTIDTDGGPVSLIEFSEYLRFLRGCYVLALDQTKFEESYEEDENYDGDLAIVTAPADVLAKSIAHNITSRQLAMSPREFELYIYRELNESEELSLLDIERNNPFAIVFAGVAIALTVAVIVSGGKFQLGPTGLKVEIPPLGDGLRRLRNALVKETRRKGGTSHDL